MTAPELIYPFPDAPEPGQTIEIAPGLLWARLELPFRLNHVNVYLLRDGDGWAIIDTGVDSQACRDAWSDIIGRLDGPITRIIVTHYHPDHVGAAAFLCTLTDAPLVMGEIEYLTAHANLAPLTGADHDTGFYRRHGLSSEHIDALNGKTGRYRTWVPDLPRTYRPLRDNDVLQIGTRQFRVFMYPGHSPAQVMLYCASDDLLLSADHVIARISPNISVSEVKPDDDPLGRYLGSFASICATVPDTALVLPGHRLPFNGLYARLADLAEHHESRCALIVAACRENPGLSTAAIVPKMFPMELDSHQFWFAFTEALAHLNYLAIRQRIQPITKGDLMGWAAL